MIEKLDGRYRLRTEQWLPLTPEDLFPFYGDPSNLEAITPSFLKFKVLTPDVEIRPGALLRYRLRVRGIPMGWTTEITEWDPPHRFVDRQLKGPYKQWDHQHDFVAQDGGTLVRDVVDFRSPGGWLVHKLFVNREVAGIFRYRQQRLEELFGDGKAV